MLEKAQAYQQYAEHFYEALQPNRLCDFAAKNRSIQVQVSDGTRLTITTLYAMLGAECEIRLAFLRELG